MSIAQAAATVVRAAAHTDCEGMAAIYNHYIRESIATFEEEPIDSDEMARRVAAVEGAGLPWLVAEQGTRLVGYAYATPWRPRSAYRFSAEATVYLDHQCAGQGLGSRLYGELFPLLQRGGIQVVIGGISLPNAASVALHEKFGMHKVAHFERVGFKFGRWIDVGYWQLSFSADDVDAGSAPASGRDPDGT